MDVPQWALDAAKTETPAYGKEHASVILVDEYLETVDDRAAPSSGARGDSLHLEAEGRGD